MIRDDREIIAVGAVVGANHLGGLRAVRAVGVQVQVTAPGVFARHVLGKRIYRELDTGVRVGRVANAQIVLALALKKGGNAQATVRVRRDCVRVATRVFGVDGRGRVCHLAYVHGVGVPRGKGNVLPKRLYGHGGLAVSKEYLGIDVVVVKRVVHICLRFPQ